MEKKRYFLDLSYHGGDFHGWQRQPESISVQEKLESALSTALRQPIEVTGCGRTDTGVHASEYYAHFDCAGSMDESLLRKVNALCGKSIAVHRFILVADTAHARYDASSRSYRYHIHFRENPFKLDTSWYWKHSPPNFEKMQQAAELLLRQKDFASFCKTNSDAKTTLCDVRSAQWKAEEAEAVFEITADRFLRGMVRLITGALMEVGQGKVSLEEFEKSLKAGVRIGHAISVPAQGLFLHSIRYPYL